MTREDILKQFPEATDEQISAILNQTHEELNKEKKKAESLKGDAKRATELQAELDRINEEKLSDIDKANKATETANNRVAELEKQMKQMQIKTQLAEKGIVGEQAEKLFNADGELDFDVLGQIITDRENAAATAKEQEIAKNAPNPGGGTPEGQNNKTDAEKIAEKLAANNKQNADNDILSHYINQ